MKIVRLVGYMISSIPYILYLIQGSHRAVVVNVFSCNIVLSEFELHLFYYIYFRVNNLRKNKPSYASSYWLNCTTTVFDDRPTKRACVAQGLFLWWVRA